MTEKQYDKILHSMRRQFREPDLNDDEFLMFMMFEVYRTKAETVETFMIDWLIWHNYFSNSYAGVGG